MFGKESKERRREDLVSKMAGEIALAPLKRELGLEVNLSPGQEAILGDVRAYTEVPGIDGSPTVAMRMGYVLDETRRLVAEQYPTGIRRLLRVKRERLKS